MNSLEKYLRTNTKLSTILYFSTLAYIIFTIYSDIYLEQPIINIPDSIDTLVFFFFLYITYIAIMIQKDNKEKKSSK